MDPEQLNIHGSFDRTACQETLRKGHSKLFSKYRVKVINIRNTKSENVPHAGEDAPTGSTNRVFGKQNFIK